MTEMLAFVFIVAVAIVLAAGALISLFLVGAVLEVLEHPEQLSARIEGAFRRPPRDPKPTTDEHYYKPYWQAR